MRKLLSALLVPALAAIAQAQAVPAPKEPLVPAPEKTEAAAPAKTEATAQKQAPAQPDKTLAMPGVRVQDRRPTQEGDPAYEAKKRGIDMEKQIVAEQRATTPTETDTILNSDKVAVLGPYSAEARATDAKARISELKVKQSVAAVTEDQDPARAEENKKLLKELDRLDYDKKHR